MINEPIYKGKLQSDLDFAGYNPLNLAGWPPSGGSGGSNVLITVNVKDSPYNATGDGVTDDTAAIQAAINAVFAAKGGTVFFPKGTYLCNGAFDATTNSILKIPFNLISTTSTTVPITIELRGETPQFEAVAPAGSIIKSTKAGTGTAPALLAAYTFVGRGVPSPYWTAFSYVQPVIRNLAFVTNPDPSIHVLRLDTAVNAIVEDVVIIAPNYPSSIEPTHGTVGLWMPAQLNFATNYINRLWVDGFDTGLVATCEHFRCPQANFLNCHLACEFLEGGELGWGNFMVFECKSAIKFTIIGAGTNRCPVIVNLNEEFQTSGWQARTTDIQDASNAGSGEIRYWAWSGSASAPLIVTGGANLRLINTFSPSKGIVPAGGTTGQVLKKLSNADYDYAWG